MALVILMRHGEAGNNVHRILAGRDDEYHLTEKGRAQVGEAAETLKPFSIEAIYTSPVTRTVETAAIVAERLGLSHSVDERLTETEMGSFSGMNYYEVLHRHGDLFLRFYSDDRALDQTGVERFSAIGEGWPACSATSPQSIQQGTCCW